MNSDEDEEVDNFQIRDMNILRENDQNQKFLAGICEKSLS